MKRWNKRATKKLVTFLMCCSLIGTTFTQMIPVYATEATTQAATENANFTNMPLE